MTQQIKQTEKQFAILDTAVYKTFKDGLIECILSRAENKEDRDF